MLPHGHSLCHWWGALASRRQPKRHLKRLYETQDAAETAEAGNDDDEEDLLEPVFGEDTRNKRKDPPIGRMSGLGPSDNGLRGMLSCWRPILAYHISYYQPIYSPHLSLLPRLAHLLGCSAIS